MVFLSVVTGVGFVVGFGVFFWVGLFGFFIYAKLFSIIPRRNVTLAEGEEHDQVEGTHAYLYGSFFIRKLPV